MIDLWIYPIAENLCKSIYGIVIVHNPHVQSLVEKGNGTFEKNDSIYSSSILS